MLDLDSTTGFSFDFVDPRLNSLRWNRGLQWQELMKSKRNLLRKRRSSHGCDHRRPAN